MMNTADEPQREPIAGSDAGGSVVSSALDSPYERAYGTFEVSLIDVESDSEQQQPLKPTQSTDFNAEEEMSNSCMGDCCAIVSFLWLPLRAETYRILLFHIVNALFAMGASAWTVLFFPIAFVLSLVPGLTSPLRRLSAAALRMLLRADAKLFNSVCPRSERVVVYNGARDGDGSYGYSAQVYFAAGKLLCNALPGVVAAAAYLWTIRNFVLVLTARPSPTSPPNPMAPVENDVLILLALIAIYAAAALSKVFAVISRQITIFFCAEYLLYASPL